MNSSLAIHSGRGARRSTRVNRAIHLDVSGVDSFRGPYHEEVSTVTVSCHGCKYESKYEVLPDAMVILQLNDKGQDSKPIPVHGRVRWTQRPAERGGLFQTAIELDAPGNIWGIDSPPSDWSSFYLPRKLDADESKAKTVAVLWPEAVPSKTREGGSGALSICTGASVSPPSPETRPVGPLMGNFQQQMERMLSEAVETVVRERATALLHDMRAGLREEAKRIVGEVASSQAGFWIDESVKRMNQLGEEDARARHVQWTNRIEAGLQQGLTRMEIRHRELEEVCERLVTKTQGQLRVFLEASHKDGVDRIIARLKEQSAPAIDHARNAVMDLTKREEEFGKTCQQYVEKSVAEIEESCTRIDNQFEMILKARLDSAREELERVVRTAANSAANDVRACGQKEEMEAQVRLRSELDPITETALATLKENATELSRQFAREMSHYSRSHLEFLSGAISELAKGVGKLCGG